MHTLGTIPTRTMPRCSAPGSSPAIAIDPAELVFVGTSPGSRYVLGAVVNGVQNEFKLYAAPLASLNGAKTPWVQDRRQRATT